MTNPSSQADPFAIAKGVVVQSDSVIVAGTVLGDDEVSGSLFPIDVTRMNPVGNADMFVYRLNSNDHTIMDGMRCGSDLDTRVHNIEPKGSDKFFISGTSEWGTATKALTCAGNPVGVPETASSFVVEFNTDFSHVYSLWVHGTDAASIKSKPICVVHDASADSSYAAFLIEDGGEIEDSAGNTTPFIGPSEGSRLIIVGIGAFGLRWVQAVDTFFSLDDSNIDISCVAVPNKLAIIGARTDRILYFDRLVGTPTNTPDENVFTATVATSDLSLGGNKIYASDRLGVYTFESGSLPDYYLNTIIKFQPDGDSHFITTGLQVVYDEQLCKQFLYLSGTATGAVYLEEQLLSRKGEIGETTAVFLKYNIEKKRVEWIHTGSSIVSNSKSSGNDLAVDSNGNVHLALSVGEEFRFGEFSLSLYRTKDISSVVAGVVSMISGSQKHFEIDSYNGWRERESWKLNLFDLTKTIKDGTTYEDSAWNRVSDLYGNLLFPSSSESEYVYVTNPLDGSGKVHVLSRTSLSLPLTDLRNSFSSNQNPHSIEYQPGWYYGVEVFSTFDTHVMRREMSPPGEGTPQVPFLHYTPSTTFPPPKYDEIRKSFGSWVTTPPIVKRFGTVQAGSTVSSDGRFVYTASVGTNFPVLSSFEMSDGDVVKSETVGGCASLELPSTSQSCIEDVEWGNYPVGDNIGTIDELKEDIPYLTSVLGNHARTLLSLSLDEEYIFMTASPEIPNWYSDNRCTFVIYWWKRDSTGVTSPHLSDMKSLTVKGPVSSMTSSVSSDGTPLLIVVTAHMNCAASSPNSEATRNNRLVDDLSDIQVYTHHRGSNTLIEEGPKVSVSCEQNKISLQDGDDEKGGSFVLSDYRFCHNDILKVHNSHLYIASRQYSKTESHTVIKISMNHDGSLPEKEREEFEISGRTSDYALRAIHKGQSTSVWTYSHDSTITTSTSNFDLSQFNVYDETIRYERPPVIKDMCLYGEYAAFAIESFGQYSTANTNADSMMEAFFPRSRSIDEVVLYDVNPTSGDLTYSDTVRGITGVSSLSCEKNRIFASGSMGVHTLHRVEPAPEHLDYCQSSFDLTMGEVVEGMIPTWAGTSSPRFSVHPPNKALSVDSVSGEVSVDTTSILDQTTFTVTAANELGASHFVIVVEIKPLSLPCSFSPSSYTFQLGDYASISLDETTEGALYFVHSDIGEDKAPSGLVFSPNSGHLEGALVEVGTFNVAVTCRRGDAVQTASLTVSVLPILDTFGYVHRHLLSFVDEPLSPNLAFFDNRNTDVSLYTFTATGLPSGVAIDSSTGTVSGSPSLTGVFDIVATATSSVGSSQSSFQIEILPSPIQRFSYSNLKHHYFVGEAVGPFSPVIIPSSSMEDLQFEVTPDLPSSLSLSPDGTISGTPTEALPQTFFHVSVWNVPFSDFANRKFIKTTVISLAVEEESVSTPFSFSVPHIVLDVGQNGISLSQPTETVSGEEEVSYAIHPSLPGSLSLNSETGVISGSCEFPVVETPFTITRLSHEGTATTVVLVQVFPLKPVVSSYSDMSPVYSYATDVVNPLLTPPSGYLFSSPILTKLKAGLSVGETTGTITGSVSRPLDRVPVTVLVTSAVGGDFDNPRLVTEIHLTITGQALSLANLAYPEETYDLPLNEAVNIVSIHNGKLPGGQADDDFGTISSSIFPPLPFGLSLSRLGNIVGVPSVATVSTQHTVTVSNAISSTTRQIRLSVAAADVAELPFPFFYRAVSAVYVMGEAISPNRPTTISPSEQGSPLVSVTQSSLFASTGLELNAVTGEIYGVPTSVLPLTHFVMVRGSQSTTVEFEIKEKKPTSCLFFDSNPLILQQGEDAEGVAELRNCSFASFASLSFSLSHDEGTPFSLDLSDGRVRVRVQTTSWFSPTIVTLTASNSAGSSFVPLEVSVLAAAPTEISFSQPLLSLGRDEILGSTVCTEKNVTNDIFGVNVTYLETICVTSNAGTSPSVSGGEVERYRLTPAVLPLGIYFNTTDGSLYGTPRENWFPQTYKISAVNRDGEKSTFIKVSVENSATTGAASESRASTIEEVDSFTRNASLLTFLMLALFVILLFLLWLSWKCRQSKMKKEVDEQEREEQDAVKSLEEIEQEGFRMEVERIIEQKKQNPDVDITAMAAMASAGVHCELFIYSFDCCVVCSLSLSLSLSLFLSLFLFLSFFLVLVP